MTKARELIDCGFYDDPEVLDALIDCCMEAITRDVNRSPAKQVHARIAPQFVARVKKSPRLTKKTCAARVESYLSA